MPEENKTEYSIKLPETTSSSGINPTAPNLEKPNNDTVSIKEKLKSYNMENKDETSTHEDQYPIVRPQKKVWIARKIIK